MTEMAEARPAVHRRVMAARRGGRVLQEHRRGLQGGDHRRHPGGRADQPLRPGRLGRPLPRPARALHRQAQGVQADQAGRRLLARRLAQRDAAAHLRHRLARREAARGLPAPARGGRETRPPHASAASSTSSTCRRRRRAHFWHPKGWTSSDRSSLHARAPVPRPATRRSARLQLLDVSLWQQSGHREKFDENMFFTERPTSAVYAIKPMNCPGLVQIFNARQAQLPRAPDALRRVRQVHRYEPSGALQGLMRVRAFTQDDGHVFCHAKTRSRRSRWPSPGSSSISIANSASRTCASNTPTGRPSVSAATRFGTAPRRR